MRLVIPRTFLIVGLSQKCFGSVRWHT